MGPGALGRVVVCLVGTVRREEPGRLAKWLGFLLKPGERTPAWWGWWGWCWPCDLFLLPSRSVWGPWEGLCFPGTCGSGEVGATWRGSVAFFTRTRLRRTIWRCGPYREWTHAAFSVLTAAA